MCEVIFYTMYPCCMVSNSQFFMWKILVGVIFMTCPCCNHMYPSIIGNDSFLHIFANSNSSHEQSIVDMDSAASSSVISNTKFQITASSIYLLIYLSNLTFQKKKSSKAQSSFQIILIMGWFWYDDTTNYHLLNKLRKEAQSPQWKEPIMQ